MKLLHIVTVFDTFFSDRINDAAGVGAVELALSVPPLSSRKLCAASSAAKFTWRRLQKRSSQTTV